jgi:predicted ATP-grasp superfamily ATP-dependent carboligase
MQSGAAIIVGGELNGLGVCRSLGQAGVATYMVDRKRLNPAMWSRYARPLLVSSLHGPELIDILLALRIKLGQRLFLAITDEMAALAISAQREKLRDGFLFRLPAHDTVMMLHNKVQFQEFAVSHGLSVPKAEIIRESSDLTKLRTLRLPIIIKPADKRHFHAGDTPRLVVAASAKEAMIACEHLLDKTGEVIAYEWIDGPDDNIYFSLFYRGRGGTLVSMFTGRKLASTPPGTGSTAFCMAASEARTAIEPITASFLERVDYAGFGSVEYKWDASARRFIIIEPTVGRTDWQEEIATLSGVNIPLDAYRHEFELPPLPHASDARQIVWQSSCIERFKLGSVTIPSGSTVIDGYWRTNDPLPAIVHYPHDLCVAAYRHAPWRRRAA